MLDGPTLDPWAPVQHEDLPPDDGDKPIKVAEHYRAARAQRREEPDEAQPVAPMSALFGQLPIAVSIGAAEALMAKLDALAESHRALSAQFDSLTATMQERADAAANEHQQLMVSIDHWGQTVTQSSAAQTGQIGRAMAAIVTDIRTAGEQSQRAMGQQVEALAAIVQRTAESLTAVEAAVLAPRKVTLIRDKAGQAVAAVSASGEPDPASEVTP